MRPGYGQYLWFRLAHVGLPEKGVALVDPPLARRLAAGNVEMQVRPAAAAAFLAQQADALAHLDLRAGLDVGSDPVQMAVAVKPAARVEEIDHVVARLHRGIIVAGQDSLAGGDYEAVGRRN